MHIQSVSNWNIYSNSFKLKVITHWIEISLKLKYTPDVNEYWYFVGIDLKNLFNGISFFDDGGTITNVGAVDKPVNISIIIIT